MIGAMSTALSGLQASTRRVEASASNIVNARDSIRTADARTSGTQPAETAPSAPPAGDEPPVYRPVRVAQEAMAGGGVRTELVEISPPHTLVYRPDDRLADADGYVARPNVDYATELVELRQAEDAYKANLKVIETADRMIGTLLDELH